MSDRVDKEVSGSAGPQPTLFEKAQLGVYAFVGGLTMDARLYSLLPIIEHNELSAWRVPKKTQDN